MYFIVFLSTVLVLIWARFSYFRIDSVGAKKVSRLYDPIVTIHIALSLYYSAITEQESTRIEIIAISFCLLGFFLFLWSLYTAKKLNFAGSDSTFSLIVRGPYSLIRHPFYLAYSLIWTSSTLLFNSYILWITLVLLVAFYIFSAKREEKAILEGKYSREYRNYVIDVGMFLPRVTQWKSWFFEQSRTVKRKKK